jgi:hypothetical protein
MAILDFRLKILDLTLQKITGRLSQSPNKDIQYKSAEQQAMIRITNDD